MRSIKDVLETATSVATLIAAGAIVWSIISVRQGGPATAPTPPSPVSNLNGVETSIASAASQRHQGAKVAIVEFSDFECPFCGRYAREVYPQVQKAYVETGDVSRILWKRKMA